MRANVNGTEIEYIDNCEGENIICIHTRIRREYRIVEIPDRSFLKKK